MSSEFRFTADNSQEVLDAMREIFLTPIGEEYKENYYSPELGEEHLEKILNAAELVAGGPHITVQNMEQALRLLIDSGEVQPRDLTPPEELAEPEEDTRPRDKNGKVLTPQQLAWSEYRQFSETASMREINERKRIDAGYASYVRKQLAAEMNQPIGDAVTPVGTSTLPKPKYADQSLAEFARKYLVERTENLKPRGGFVTLSGEQIPYSRFIDLVNKATAARLL